MDDAVLINSIDRIDHLQSIIRQDLRDVGVKLPKSKKVKKLNQSRSFPQSQDDVFASRIFGEHLCLVPSTFLPQYGYVPKFLVDAAKVVDKHLDSEGLFRKSGSIGRQKELRAAIEEGNAFDDANVYDVAVLIKQFFRELPEPLLVSIYHDALVRCFQLPADKDPLKALLNICLLHPVENIGALRFFMHLLCKVAAKSDKNKMTANNLALVVVPNLIHSSKGAQKMSSAEEKLMHMQTCIVELYIKNWEQIGVVTSSLRQQINLMSECFGTDDDLDASDDNTLEESKDISHKKKRKRSSSLTGIVNTIAHGFAKLRRSTDGKSINMSTNSTYRGELSLASNTSVNQTQDILNNTTPCVMRKRRASGDGVPFSASKKQAILGNLPHKSALGATPFTPGPKREHLHDDSCFEESAKVHRLNVTSPVIGSKTSKKKLNLFGTPSGSKNVKKPGSSRYQSPAPKDASVKSKNLLRRLSGNRAEKDSLEALSACEQVGERLAVSMNISPDSALSDSVMQEKRGKLIRSLSSPTLPDPESSIIIVDDDVSPFEVGAAPHRLASQQDEEDEILDVDVVDSNGIAGTDAQRYFGRSKSADSPGVKRGQPNTLTNGLHKCETGHTSKARSKVDKIDIGAPNPIIIPVVPDGVEIRGDSELRRSRRDEFEKEKRRKDKSLKKHNGAASLPSDPSHSNLDVSLMEAVLPPPHGFGDQTMLEAEQFDHDKCDDEDDFEIDIESDGKSEAGFSTISGGTVLRRTKSGRYSTSGTSITSSASCDLLTKGAKSKSSTEHTLGCVDSLLSAQSQISRGSVGLSKISRSASSDSGRDSLTNEMTDSAHDTYVSLRPSCSKQKEDDYVVLRRATNRGESSSAEPILTTSKGMTMLCENYTSVSEEDSSSPSSLPPADDKDSNLNVSLGSHQDDLDNMPSHHDVHRKKSISAEDLQSPKMTLPPRAHSVCASPMKRFNYKPHLEITRETHNLLARAGYIRSIEAVTTAADVTVPVKSPKRSNYREEMMAVLRSSFHERHSHLNASVRSKRSLQSAPASETPTSDRLSLSNTSLTGECEKLSLNGRESMDVSSVAHGRCDTDIEHGPVAGTSNAKSSDCEGDKEQIHGPAESVNIEQNDAETVADSKDEEVDTVTESEENVSVENTIEDSDTATKTGPGTALHGRRHKPAHASKALKHLSDSDKALTLSGILDKEIASQVQIKRAEMVMPKHDSVINMQQAGIVAQSVRQFSQQRKAPKFSGPPTSKRGTSPVRIPTIFAKTEEKAKHYKEIAQFMRERTGPKEFMNMPAIPSTPNKTSGNDEELDMSDDESSNEGNITVLEVDTTEKSSSMNGTSSTHDHLTDIKDRLRKTTSQNGSSSSTQSTAPLKGAHIDLSESLMATINDVCTPRSEKFPSGGGDGRSPIKSPLNESTNTAPVAGSQSSNITENVKAHASSSRSPYKPLLQNDPTSLCKPVTPGPVKTHRAHVKRLTNSPHRRNASRQRPNSPHAGKSDSQQKLSSVPIPFEDESSQ